MSVLTATGGPTLQKNPQHELKTAEEARARKRENEK